MEKHLLPLITQTVGWLASCIRVAGSVLLFTHVVVPPSRSVKEEAKLLSSGKSKTETR